MLDTFFHEIFDLLSQMKRWKSNQTENKTNECLSNVIDVYNLSMWYGIPSSLLILVFSILSAVRSMRLTGRKRIFITIPMDCVDSSTTLWVPYLLSFSLSAIFVTLVVVNPTPFAINALVREVMRLVCVFVFGTVVFPFFAAATDGSALAGLLGGCYCLSWIGFFSFNFIVCVSNSAPDDPILSYLLIRYFIPFLCLALLTSYLLVRSVLALRHFGAAAVLRSAHEPDMSHVTRHVKELLIRAADRRIKRENDEFYIQRMNCCKRLLVRFWVALYPANEGFKFPPRLIGTLFASMVILFLIASEYIVPIQAFCVVLISRLEAVATNSHYNAAQLFYLMQHDPNFTINENDLAVLGKYLLWLLDYCILFSFIFPIIMACFQCILVALHFRRDVCCLNSGKSTLLLNRKNTSGASFIYSFTQFAGFQSAYMVGGCLVQIVALLIFSIFVCFFVYMPLRHGFGDFWLNFLYQVWIYPVIFVAMYISFSIITRFVFMYGSENVFNLTNRRAFFVWMHYMYFYNIFLGLLSSLIRIIISIIIGLTFIGRVDYPLLSQSLAHRDSGHNSYLGFLRVTCAFNNPVLRCFLRLLDSGRKRRDSMQNFSCDSSFNDETPVINTMNDDSESAYGATRSGNVCSRAQKKWLLLFTLLRNPQLQFERR